MKFVCDNCSGQYLISDDKVGPKGVKVRCKRCGNVIIVRPGEPDHRDTDPGTTGPGATDDEAPFGFGQSEGDPDEVGQAFDHLLQDGLGEEDEDEDGEEQATEIFRMEDLQRDHRDGRDDDLEKIDRVFARAESTEIKPGADGEDDDRSDWYVAVGDEQVGPMGLAEIETRWVDGEIEPKTLAWHPGMPDWTPIEEIPRLRYLLGVLGSRQAGQRESTEVDAPEEQAGQRTPQPVAEEEWAPYKGSTLSSLVEEEMAASGEEKGEPQPADDEKVEQDAEGVIPGDDAPTDDWDVPPWEQDEPVSGEVARPPESFFDSSLDKPAEEMGGGYFGGTHSRSGRVLAGPAYLGGSKRGGSKNKLILFGVLGVVIVACGALAVIKLTGGPEPAPDKVEPIEPPGGLHGPPDKPKKPDEPKKPDARGPEGDQDAASTSKPEDGKGKPDSKPKDDGDSGKKEIVVSKPSADTKAGSAVERKPDKPARPVSKKRKRRRRVAAADTGKPDKPPPAKPEKPADSGSDSDLPQKLSKSQISKTMKKYIKSMKACVEQQRQRDPSVTGTMKVSFVIKPNGNVSDIAVKTSEHKGTYVAGCISFIIKSMKFPKAREPFTVPVLPLKLGG